MVVPSQKLVDTTLIPLSKLLWRRTTLARRNQVWELLEFSEDVTTLESMSEPIPGEGVDLVLTIAHDSQDLTLKTWGLSTLVIPCLGLRALLPVLRHWDLHHPELHMCLRLVFVRLPVM